MLSERLSQLFELLQCSNTDIARYIGCSPSNVSRLKSGGREPSPSSRTVARLADGIYRYADYENLLPVLCELCETSDDSSKRLVPAIISWLFETRSFTIPRTVTPKSKRVQALMRQSFGERLERVMALLELSNAQLASQMNVDVSLISRYRGGIYSPHGNEAMLEKLSGVLFSRALRVGHVPELAQLCALSEADTTAETLAEWLCAEVYEEPSALARVLLTSLDSLAPLRDVPPAALPDVQERSCYWGTAGLREAIVRFLRDTAEKGGELLFYSDEPLNWLTGDRDFFSLSTSLMAKCIQNGVKIKLVHNVDRDSREMADAVNSWLPFYLSGMVEPYVFRRPKNTRFCHTVFLRVGDACIRGFSLFEADDHWYDYITDKDKLNSLEAGFRAMLDHAAPLLRTYLATRGGDFRRFCDDRMGSRSYMLSGLPVFTMPDKLLARVLVRAELSEKHRAELLALYRARRARFFTTLREESVKMIFTPPDPASVRSGVRVNFAADLLDVPLNYTHEEYAEHVAAVSELVRKERNFHLTLLPAAPFHDIQIVTLKDTVAVLRCQDPCAAFVFTNPVLTQSLSDYFDTLIDLHSADRSTVVHALGALTGEGR